MAARHVKRLDNLFAQPCFVAGQKSRVKNFLVWSSLNRGQVEITKPELGKKLRIGKMISVASGPWLLVVRF